MSPEARPTAANAAVAGSGVGRHHTLWPGLRRRTLGVVVASVFGSVSFGLLVFAAYHGLARAMVPELAAAVLGLALILVGAIAYVWSRRDRGPAAERPDTAAEVGEAVAGLLRRADGGTSNLAGMSLLAGWSLAQRKSVRSILDRGADSVSGNGHAH